MTIITSFVPVKMPLQDPRMSTEAEWGFSAVGTFLMFLIPFILSVLHIFLSTDKIKWMGRWLLGSSAGFLLMTMVSQLFIEDTERAADSWEIALCFLLGYTLSLAGMNTHHHEEKTVLEQAFVTGGGYDEPVIEPTVFRDGIWVKGMVANELARNFCNGLLLSAAFLGCTEAMGWLVTCAILIGEIPMKISNQWNLVVRGQNIYRATAFNLLSTLPIILGWLVINIAVEISPTHVDPELVLALGTGVVVYTTTQHLSGVQSRFVMLQKTIHAALFLVGGIIPAIVISGTHFC